MSDDKPVTIMAVDTEEKISAVIPIIAPMLREVLILLQDVEMISIGMPPLSRPDASEDI